MDSAISMLASQIEKPGKTGMEEALKILSDLKFDGTAGYLFGYDCKRQLRFARA